MLRRAAYVVVIGLFPVGVLFACSDPPAKPAPSVAGNASPPNVVGAPIPEGGVATDAAIDGKVAEAGEAGVCNDVPLGGSVIERIGVANEPPVATGGTVEDGLYDLTDRTVYVGAAGVAGPTGITEKASMRIKSGKADEANVIGGTGKTPTSSRTSGAYSATGATFAQTELCPSVGGGKQRQFTANPPLLILTDLVTKEAYTFTKR